MCVCLHIDTILYERDWKRITCARQSRTFFMSLSLLLGEVFGAQTETRKGGKKEEQRLVSAPDPFHSHSTHAHKKGGGGRRKGSGDKA